MTRMKFEEVGPHILKDSFTCKLFPVDYFKNDSKANKNLGGRMEVRIETRSVNGIANIYRSSIKASFFCLLHGEHFRLVGTLFHGYFYI